MYSTKTVPCYETGIIMFILNNFVLSIFKTRAYQSTAALLSSLQVATCAVQLLNKTKMTIVSVSLIAMNFEQWQYLATFTQLTDGDIKHF
ncbi:hypothetical protein T01_12925, partial [Trichinella spiralis]